VHHRHPLYRRCFATWGICIVCIAAAIAAQKPAEIEREQPEAPSLEE
jgi:hypothetical protein